MDAIDKRLKDKQDAMRRLEAEEADKRQQMRERQARDDKRRVIEEKKNEEVQKEMQLMRARKEAYEERLALKAKVDARKAAEARERDDEIDRNNAEARQAAKREDKDR